MNSKTLPSFWKAYKNLDEEVKQQAKKAYFLWTNNPSHPSLRFERINRKENLWSVRITREYRAIGLFENDTLVWFWIGNHDDYEKYFG